MEWEREREREMVTKETIMTDRKEAKSGRESTLAVVAVVAAGVEAVETAWSKQGRGKGLARC